LLKRAPRFGRDEWRQRGSWVLAAPALSERPTITPTTVLAQIAIIATASRIKTIWPRVI
jgi:hypothetical protein